MKSLLSTRQTAFVTVRSWCEMIPHAQSIDADTLVIFDVDYVLTHPSEPALQMANFIRYKDLFKSCFLSLPPEEQDIAAPTPAVDQETFSQRISQLVEEARLGSSSRWKRHQAPRKGVQDVSPG